MDEELVARTINTVQTRMQDEGAFSDEEVRDLIDDVIDSLLHDGHITDDEDVEVLRSEVLHRLSEEEDVEIASEE